MEQEKKWRIAIYAIIGLLIWLFGFQIGREHSEKVIDTKTEYIEGKTIHDTVNNPIPKYINKPIDTLNIIQDCIKNGIYAELFPNKTIEVIKYVPVSADTLAILKDWATTRNYSEILFDSDTLGKCTFNANIQYNRLSDYSYQFTPITKQITITKKKINKLSPYFGIGYMNHPLGQIGFFINDRYGISAQYQYDLNNSKGQLGILALYKF